MSNVVKRVILQSGENEEAKRERFPVDEDIALCSDLVKNMLNLEGEGGVDSEDNVIPLHNVTAPTLKKVVDWAIRNKSEPMESSSWKEEFLKEMDQATLFDMVCAANYMDIKPLLDALTGHVASMIKGKSPSEIRRYFSFKRDIEVAAE